MYVFYMRFEPSLMTAGHHPEHRWYSCRVTDREHILWPILCRLVPTSSLTCPVLNPHCLDSSFYYTCCRGRFRSSLSTQILKIYNSTRFSLAYI